MALPYERQIWKLLQELLQYRAVAERSRQEKARYAEDLWRTCKEIEQALDELGKHQKCALEQWKEVGTEERSRILAPVSEGIEKMTVLAQQKGCEAMGEYLEIAVMEEVLIALELP